MKKYAELYGNMQKHRIKNLCGNNAEKITKEQLQELGDIVKRIPSNDEILHKFTEQQEKLKEKLVKGEPRPSLRQLRDVNRVNS
ncbi:MAG TPA: hypothetical protein GXX59_03965 [Syntrophomonadaceae bacterium]|nr:hypothetical protein [Syntrophomonadaceae bacterium]